MAPSHVLFLDEPTTGLHVHDVKILIESLQKIVDQENTIIAIEHQPDFILFLWKTCVV